MALIRKKLGSKVHRRLGISDPSLHLASRVSIVALGVLVPWSIAHKFIEGTLQCYTRKGVLVWRGGVRERKPTLDRLEHDLCPGGKILRAFEP
jgi:hypothetical protein